jgi:hypothetical protein
MIFPLILLAAFLGGFDSVLLAERLEFGVRQLLKLSFCILFPAVGQLRHQVPPPFFLSGLIPRRL